MSLQWLDSGPCACGLASILGSIDSSGRRYDEGIKSVLGGNESVRVCIAQVSPAYMDREESTRRACQVIAEAGANGARLVVFPEVWLSGYPYWTEGWDSPLGQWAGGRIRFFDEAVMVPSATTEAIGQAARQANVYVVMGCNEIDPRPAVNTIYNSLLFFDRDGSLMGRHRKLMPTFTERLFWGQGDASDLAVYETDIGRIGGLICGENLMTPLRAAMMSMGEDFHIAVFPALSRCIPGRSLRNGTIVARSGATPSPAPMRSRPDALA